MNVINLKSSEIIDDFNDNLINIKDQLITRELSFNLFEVVGDDGGDSNDELVLRSTNN